LPGLETRPYNRRGGEKLEFDPARAVRYHERIVTEIFIVVLPS
jgi:hypothetical protein